MEKQIGIVSYINACFFIVICYNIALCGDCNCDVEHGISITFRNRKFAGVSTEAEFAETDNYDEI